MEPAPSREKSGGFLAYWKMACREALKCLLDAFGHSWLARLAAPAVGLAYGVGDWLHSGRPLDLCGVAEPAAWALAAAAIALLLIYVGVLIATPPRLDAAKATALTGERLRAEAAEAQALVRVDRQAFTSALAKVIDQLGSLQHEVVRSDTNKSREGLSEQRTRYDNLRDEVRKAFEDLWHGHRFAAIDPRVADPTERNRWMTNFPGLYPQKARLAHSIDKLILALQGELERFPLA